MITDLTIPQQCCLRLLRLMAAPSRRVDCIRLICDRYVDADYNRYLGHIRVLEKKGYLKKIPDRIYAFEILK
jgi:hypothetical protein